MPVLTPKPRTEPREVRLTFVGPWTRRKEAVTSLQALGFVATSAPADAAVSWRTAFPEYTDEMLPGVCLAGLRQRESMTQAELGARTGIPQRHISEMEHGKRPIGRETARKLAAVFGVSYRLFR